MLSIKLRSSSKGTQHLQIAKDSTLNELQKVIEKNTGIAPQLQKILIGHPSKEVQGASNDKIGLLGIENSTTLTIEQLKQAIPTPVASTSDTSSPIPVQETLPVPTKPTLPAPTGSIPIVGEDGVIVRRVIPADNSCLFNAVGYVLEHNRNATTKLRNVIAQTVASDPKTYTTAFLGKTNQEYQQWILLPDAWGGAIELSILSDYYQTEIAAFDIQNVRMDLYGETKNYKQRVALIYDGIHYDSLALTFDKELPEDMDITIFNPSDAFVVAKALEVTEEANKAKQFTDVSKFDLRCMVCQKGLVGQEGAVNHAKETGHTNFAEYS